MKDEIKEILDNLVVNETTGMCYLSIKLTKQIKDCITNLQEENYNLKNVIYTGRSYNEVLKSEEDYKSRIEKAIEYMNNTYDITDIKELFYHYNRVESILKREDE